MSLSWRLGVVLGVRGDLMNARCEGVVEGLLHVRDPEGVFQVVTRDVSGCERNGGGDWDWKGLGV